MHFRAMTQTEKESVDMPAHILVYPLWKSGEMSGFVMMYHV